MECIKLFVLVFWAPNSEPFHGIWNFDCKFIAVDTYWNVENIFKLYLQLLTVSMWVCVLCALCMENIWKDKKIGHKCVCRELVNACGINVLTWACSWSIDIFDGTRDSLMHTTSHIYCIVLLSNFHHKLTLKCTHKISQFK